MIIEAKLPDNVLKFEYAMNSHYVKITTKDKRTVTLYAKDINEGKCVNCDYVLYAEDPVDMVCPRCLSEIKWMWGEARVSFIQKDEENESK